VIFRPRKLTGDDIALAMELHSEGLQAQHIATGLGVSTKTLRKSIAYAEKHGYRKAPAPVCRRNRTAQVNERAAMCIGASAVSLTRHCENAPVDQMGEAKA
jgi:transposase